MKPNALPRVNKIAMYIMFDFREGITVQHWNFDSTKCGKWKGERVNIHKTTQSLLATAILLYKRPQHGALFLALVLLFGLLGGRLLRRLAFLLLAEFFLSFLLRHLLLQLQDALLLQCAAITGPRVAALLEPLAQVPLFSLRLRSSREGAINDMH
jgi:uncharacterized membrane protein YhhN